MNGYHELDGVPCTSNGWLLTDLLRGEWGFDGTVLSDYFSVAQLYEYHRVVESRIDAAAAALAAGVDVELPGTDCYGDPPAGGGPGRPGHRRGPRRGRAASPRRQVPARPLRAPIRHRRRRDGPHPDAGADRARPPGGERLAGAAAQRRHASARSVRRSSIAVIGPERSGRAQHGRRLRVRRAHRVPARGLEERPQRVLHPRRRGARRRRSRSTSGTSGPSWPSWSDACPSGRHLRARLRRAGRRPVRLRGSDRRRRGRGRGDHGDGRAVGSHAGLHVRGEPRRGRAAAAGSAGGAGAGGRGDRDPGGTRPGRRPADRLPRRARGRGGRADGVAAGRVRPGGHRRGAGRAGQPRRQAPDQLPAQLGADPDLLLPQGVRWAVALERRVRRHVERAPLPVRPRAVVLGVRRSRWRSSTAPRSARATWSSSRQYSPTVDTDGPTRSCSSTAGTRSRRSPAPCRSSRASSASRSTRARRRGSPSRCPSRRSASPVGTWSTSSNPATIELMVGTSSDEVQAAGHVLVVGDGPHVVTRAMASTARVEPA